MQSNKMQFGVAFVQMHVTDNKLQNIHHAERLIRAAVAKHQPRLIVLPEYFNTKWGQQYVEQFAERFPTGETFVALQRLAKELNVYVVGGSMPERDDQYVYNTTVVFAPTGELIAKYRKIHPIDMNLEKQMLATANDDDYYQLNETEFIKGGAELTVFAVDGIRIGLGIGYDMSFGELSRLYRLQGVELLIFPSLVPATFGYQQQWEHMNRARAIDNQMYVLGVSQARNDACPEFVQYGHSMLVDYHGKVLARAGDAEEFLYAHLKFDELQTYRKQFNLFAHKRNDIYETIYKH